MTFKNNGIVRQLDRTESPQLPNKSHKILQSLIMRKEYDFTDAEPNPYIKKLRKQISIQEKMSGGDGITKA